MIVVNNTKELEQRYNLNMIPDSEMIQVLGGLAGKQKYGAEKYQRRVTYPARQLKQIILEMQEIEREIPPTWNDWQKAKYIYETLADNIDYNYNKQDYDTQQCSNLTVLLSKKGICAGYSLLYKEMMDRQGIPCDYMRGKAILENGQTGMHAWNVLSIGGNSIAVDLTWDSGARRNGEKGLKHFGDNPNFLLSHNADIDEYQYRLSNFSKESIDAISTDLPVNNINQDFTKDRQMSSICYAISATYKKFRGVVGEEAAIEQAKNAVYKYITEANAQGFTRDSNARNVIIGNMKPNECLDLILKSYTKQTQMTMNEFKGALHYSVRENMAIYGIEHAQEALKRYIISGNAECFTRNNDARNILKANLTPELALKSAINDIVLREIEEQKVADIARNMNIRVMREQYMPGDEYVSNPASSSNKRCFYANELSQVTPPKEKGILTKAIDWIKDKIKLRQNQKNINNNQLQNQRRPDEYQR